MARVSRFVLAHRAAGMRSAPTTTEALLWSRLSGSQLGMGFSVAARGGAVHRGLCGASVRLIVEVDGACHRERADARRDRDLARLGWRVVRVPADVVLRRLGDVVVIVRAALGQEMS